MFITLIWQFGTQLFLKNECNGWWLPKILENADSCQALKGQTIKNGMEDDHMNSGGHLTVEDTKRDGWLWSHKHQRSFDNGRYKKGLMMTIWTPEVICQLKIRKGIDDDQNQLTSENIIRLEDTKIQKGWMMTQMSSDIGWNWQWNRRKSNLNGWWYAVISKQFIDMWMSSVIQSTDEGKRTCICCLKC